MRVGSMYSNTSFDFDYNLSVDLIESKTGKKITSFNAREVDAERLDAGFAGGGIASYGQSYVIATNKNIKDKVKAYSCQVVINGGLEYKVLNVGITQSRIGALNCYNKKQEVVLYLG